MILEYKDFGQTKDVDSKNRIITGYLSTFGNKDSHGDIIVKGAYVKTIAERKEDIFFLNQHNWQQPHGKFSVLKEDDKGLYFESEPLIDTTYSSDALKLYEAGILKEHSIGYNVMDSERKDDARYLRELKLWEGSCVTVGANRDTPFTGFKTSMKEINEQTKLIIKALRDGDFTDDTFKLLEIGLKQLQKQAFELGKNTLKEPFTDTLVIEPLLDETKAINEYLKTKR